MPISIRKIGTKYTAEITPPHGHGVRWHTGKPLSRDELIAVLEDRGCHQTDIGDALYEADPRWLRD